MPRTIHVGDHDLGARNAGEERLVPWITRRLVDQLESQHLLKKSDGPVEIADAEPRVKRSLDSVT